jgi:hypothetical protein
VSFVLSLTSLLPPRRARPVTQPVAHPYAQLNATRRQSASPPTPYYVWFVRTFCRAVLLALLLTLDWKHGPHFLVLTHQATFARPPRWQDVLNKPAINTTSTGERQRVSTPCPSPNRALRVYACVCCHLHTFMPAFTVEPACARALSIYEVCSLTRLPFLGTCAHTNPLCAPSPPSCSLLLCALRGSSPSGVSAITCTYFWRWVTRPSARVWAFPPVSMRKRRLPPQPLLCAHTNPLCAPSLPFCCCLGALLPRVLCVVLSITCFCPSLTRTYFLEMGGPRARVCAISIGSSVVYGSLHHPTPS